LHGLYRLLYANSMPGHSPHDVMCLYFKKHGWDKLITADDIETLRYYLYKRINRQNLQAQTVKAQKPSEFEDVSPGVIKIFEKAEHEYLRQIWNPGIPYLQKNARHIQNLFNEKHVEIFERAREFYQAPMPKQPYTVALHPLPPSKGAQIDHSDGQYMSISVRCDDKLVQLGDIFHEICHCFDHAGTRREGMEKELSARPEGEAKVAAMYLEEILATAWGQGVFQSALAIPDNGKLWYGNSDSPDSSPKKIPNQCIDRLARDIAPLIDSPDLVRHIASSFAKHYPQAHRNPKLMFRWTAAVFSNNPDNFPDTSHITEISRDAIVRFMQTQNNRQLSQTIKETTGYAFWHRFLDSLPNPHESAVLFINLPNKDAMREFIDRKVTENALKINDNASVYYPADNSLPVYLITGYEPEDYKRALKAVKDYRPPGLS